MQIIASCKTSFQGLPTEIYLYGTQLVMNILGCVVGVVLVRNVILPVVYPLRLVSLFQVRADQYV